MAEKVKKMGLQDFFIYGLEEVYDAEKKFMKCFAALGITAVGLELRNALTAHSIIMENHKADLEVILNSFSRRLERGHCGIASCLADKASDMIRLVETGTALRDVAIICLVQIIQHYKISCYGSLLSLTYDTGNMRIHAIIEKCLDEEKKMDRYLTEIAKDFVNPAAKNESIS